MSPRTRRRSVHTVTLLSWSSPHSLQLNRSARETLQANPATHCAPLPPWKAGEPGWPATQLLRGRSRTPCCNCMSPWPRSARHSDQSRCQRRRYHRAIRIASHLRSTPAIRCQTHWQPRAALWPTCSCQPRRIPGHGCRQWGWRAVAWSASRVSF